MLKRLRDLAHSGGPALALITKKDLADLVCLVDQCVSTGGGEVFQAALTRNVELRNQLAAVTGHNHTLADIVRRKDRESRNHGDERRRYMDNNRALKARVEELDQECQDYVDNIGILTKNARKHGNERRKMRQELALLRTKIELIKGALE